MVVSFEGKVEDETGIGGSPIVCLDGAGEVQFVAGILA